MHVLLYSRDAVADRAFLRDALGWPYVVDSTDSSSEEPWLIFRTPPTELGVHPTDGEQSIGMYLMCDDLDTTAAEPRSHGAVVSESHTQEWGVAVMVTLPSGTTLGVYQPSHPTAHGV